MRLGSLVIARCDVELSFDTEPDPTIWTWYLYTTGNECCELHLMDSASQRVAIETSSSLRPATYSAVRLRVCSTDTVLVQLWRYIDDVTYEFRWQLQFTPSSTQTSLTYVTVCSRDVIWGLFVRQFIVYVIQLKHIYALHNYDIELGEKYNNATISR